MQRHTLRRAHFACAALVLALAGTPAGAFTTDARRLGMGSAHVPGSRDLAAANVAVQAVPARAGARGFTLPLPLGLVQLATDFPTLDPEDPDFSATRLANLALNPPFFLELTEPGDLNGDITIAMARDEFSILFADAQRLLPQRPIDVGGLYARPLAGLGLRGARTYVSPLLLLEGQMGFDDALYGVLARGEPLRTNRTYRMSAGGEASGGLSMHAGWTGGGGGHPCGDGVYVGAFAKYILGLGFGRADARFTLTSSDTLFGAGSPLDVGYESTTRHAPFGRIGTGYGFDTGVVVRRGGWDAGLGLRDLGARVRWSTEVQHTALDEATSALVTTTVARDEPYVQRLPMQTTLHVAWSGARTLLAADVTTSRWSTELHVGAERRLGPLAVRAGMLTDAHQDVQVAWGAGLGLARLWLDVGFQTHGRTLTGERGLTLGTSLGLR